MAKKESAFQWASKTPFALGKALAGIPKEARRVAVDGINVIAKQAATNIARRTPGKDLPKGWTMEVESNNVALYKVEIVNEDPRAYALKSLRDGRSTNLMEMLEYGTSPSQPIYPVKAKALRFVDPDTGQVVFAKRVNPRGIRPHGMIRITFFETIGKMARLQLAVAKIIKKKAGAK